MKRLAAIVAALLLAGLMPATALATSPPDASDVSVTTNEDQMKVVTVTATDPDGSDIDHFSVDSPPTHGSLGSFSAPDCTPGPACTATIDYTPNADFNGSDSFDFTATDTDGETSTATGHITITPVNDPPDFTNGGDVTVNEDSGAHTEGGWANPITKGASNESGQTLTFTVTADDPSLFSAGPSVDESSGDLTFTPKANANGNTDVQVSLQDNAGGDDTSATKTFTITINEVNDAPDFTNGGDVTVAEDSALHTDSGWASPITKGPSNESTQTLTFTVTADDPSLFSVGPSVNTSNGNLTFTPAASTFGSTNVDVSLRDSGGTLHGGHDTSAIKSFTITITHVNHAPTAVTDTLVIDEDSGTADVDVLGNDSDPDAGDTLKVTGVGGPASKGTQGIGANGDSATYRPDANANGSDSFSYTVSDGHGGTDGGTVNVTINSVNDAPTFTKGGNQTDPEDSPAQSVPSWATAIFEGAANESAQTVSFTVTNNDNGLFTVQPAVAANGTLTYTAKANANGVATVSVEPVDNGGTANGGQDTGTTQTFTITITPVNDQPSFTAGADETVTEDPGPQSVSGWATDISTGPSNESGQAITFVVTNNNNALFSAQPDVAPDGTLTYTPAADANGIATVTVHVEDDGGTAGGGDDTSPNQTITITVTAVNDAPSFTKGADSGTFEDAPLQSDPGWATNISNGGPDEAGQALTFVVTGNTNPTLFSVAPAISSTGTLTFQPAHNKNGTATITFHLSDGIASSSDATFVIDISGQNDPPNASNDLGTVKLAGPASINVLGNDNGGPGEPADTVHITSVHEGSHGIVTITGGGTGLTYDPIGCSTGTDTFTYTVTDTGGLTDSATVLVTISKPASYPAADGPRPGFVTNSTAGSTTSVRMSWCGLTSGTTLKKYRLDQSTNGGSYKVKVTSTTSTSSKRSLGSSRYLFRARITDKKNHTAFGYGPAFRVIKTQDSSSAIVYSTGWSKTTSGSPSGGSAHKTSGTSKTATLIYTGRAFAIVGTKGKHHGSFNVYVDGVRVTSKAVKTSASKTEYKRVLYWRSLASGRHTIAISTSGNGRVDLDAILTIATP